MQQKTAGFLSGGPSRSRVYGFVWGVGPSGGWSGAQWGLGPAVQEATGASPGPGREDGGAQPPGNTIVGGSLARGLHTSLHTESHLTYWGRGARGSGEPSAASHEAPVSSPDKTWEGASSQTHGAAGGSQFLAGWVAPGPVPHQLEAALRALPRAWLTDSSQHLPASCSGGRPPARAVSPPCH